MKLKYPRIFLFLSIVPLFVFLYFAVLAFQGTFTFPTEISLGPLKLRLYGLILLIAIISSAMVFEYILKDLRDSGKKNKDLKRFDLYESLIWIVVPGVIFARAVYYLTFVNDYYKGSFADVYKIWEGGMHIYGAIIGGVIGLILYMKKAKINLFPILDLVFIVLPLGHAIGRWANFVNQEIFGPSTNLPWKMYIAPENRVGIPAKYQTESFFHPLFLYEFILNLGLFFLLYKLFRKNKIRFHGFIVAVYAVGYGLIRFFIEFLRFDPAPIFGLSIAQVISLFMIIGGGAFLIFKMTKQNGKN